MKKRTFIKILSLVMAMLTLLGTVISCDKAEQPNDAESTAADTEPVDDSPASVNGVDLKNFVIVHAADETSKSIAEEIKTAIMEDVGYDLPIAQTDATEEKEYEIIIGNVDRALAKSFYDNINLNYNYFDLTVSGKKVALLYGCERVVSYAKRAFIKIFDTTDTDPIRLTDASSQRGDLFGDPAIAINRRPNDTDIRIAGNNIYFHQKEAAAIFKNRKDDLLTSFRYFDADILMLQECGTGGYSESLVKPPKDPLSWHKVIDEELVAMGYTYVPANPKSKLFENYTPIWYRAEKVELVECKFYTYVSVKEAPDGHLSSSKSYTMAVFKDKNTGKQFACLSTHFTWAGDPDQANRLRKSDATEITAEVKALKEKYGKDFPIFLMGDLNCKVDSEPYNILLAELYNVRDTKDMVKKGVSYGTTHSLGKSPSMGGGVIDHTLISGTGFKPTQYHHVVNKWATASTDHIPLILDVDFR